jgi:predicted nucleic acid-binding protein
MGRYAAPSLIAIDTSAFVELLLQSPTAARVEQVVEGTELVAPDLLNSEVLQSLRGLERAGKLTSSGASEAMLQLLESPVKRVPTLGLMREAWSMRLNVSAYDACYVALARTLGCPLVSADRRLAGAPGLEVALIVV